MPRRFLFGIWSKSHYQGKSIPSSHVVIHTVCSQVSQSRYDISPSLYCAVELLCSTEDTPPVFVDTCNHFPNIFIDVPAVQTLCVIQINLKDFPTGAFRRTVGPAGVYYAVTYQLEIHFAALINFKVRCNGLEYGNVTARYI